MMETVSLNVQGMTCNHCKASVEKAVGALDGVQSVEVILAENKVNVELNSSVVTKETLKNTIEDIGFDVVE